MLNRYFCRTGYRLYLRFLFAATGVVESWNWIIFNFLLATKSVVTNNNPLQTSGILLSVIMCGAIYIQYFLNENYMVPALLATSCLLISFVSRGQKPTRMLLVPLIENCAYNKKY